MDESILGSPRQWIFALRRGIGALTPYGANHGVWKVVDAVAVSLRKFAGHASSRNCERTKARKIIKGVKDAGFTFKWMQKS